MEEDIALQTKEIINMMTSTSGASFHENQCGSKYYNACSNIIKKEVEDEYFVKSIPQNVTEVKGCREIKKEVGDSVENVSHLGVKRCDESILQAVTVVSVKKEVESDYSKPSSSSATATKKCLSEVMKTENNQMVLCLSKDDTDLNMGDTDSEMEGESEDSDGSFKEDFSSTHSESSFPNRCKCTLCMFCTDRHSETSGDIGGDKNTVSKETFSKTPTPSSDAEEESFYCACDESSSANATLCDDMIMNYQVRQPECSTCNKTISLETILILKHGKDYLKSNDVPRCSICDKTYVSAKSYKRHVLNIHNMRPQHLCGHCNTAFLSAAALKRHMRGVHNVVIEKAHKCLTCCKSFDLECQLKRHIYNHHSGINPHRCKICNKTFSQPSNLKHHILSSHQGVKPYKCSLCGNSFARANSLEYHQKCFHNGEREHKCPFCGKGFGLAAGLKYHIQYIHEGEKPYACLTCSKTFARPNSLNRHVKRAHSNSNVVDKPFKCKTCHKSFPHEKRLQIHVTRFHKGEDSHECDQCGKLFSRIGWLNKHILQAHGIEKKPSKG